MQSIHRKNFRGKETQSEPENHLLAQPQTTPRGLPAWGASSRFAFIHQWMPGRTLDRVATNCSENPQIQIGHAFVPDNHPHVQPLSRNSLQPYSPPTTHPPLSRHNATRLAHSIAIAPPRFRPTDSFQSARRTDKTSQRELDPIQP
jgi:hypothetical protein